MTNVVVPNLPRDRQEGWSAGITLEKGDLMIRDGKWSIDANAALAIRDTRPIIAVLRAQESAPGWLNAVPTIKDIRGRTAVAASPATLRLSDVDIEGKGTEVKAELLIETNRMRGLVYARYGLLSAGFDLREAKRHWRIFGAKRWYDRASASPERPGPGED